MPTIPTPFIGGADSPKRDTAEGKELARPYAPGWEEPEAPVTPEPEPEPEVDRTPWEPVVEAEDVDIDVEFVPVEAEAADWDTEPERPEPAEAPPEPAESLEPQEAAPAEPVLAEFKTVALRPAEPPLPPGGGETVSTDAGFEPTRAAEAEVEVAATTEGAEEESEFPAYLFGPDVTEGEAPSEPIELAGATSSSEAGETEDTGDRLTEFGRELLTGEEGEEIRALIADLRPLTADIAVPRAFAAGYLAAKRRQEK